jgi:hypothetical protein
MRDVSVQVSELHVSTEPPCLSFRVTLGIQTLEPISDADGELFNQRFGQEILYQVIEQLRRDPH